METKDITNADKHQDLYTQYLLWKSRLSLLYLLMPKGTKLCAASLAQ